MAYRMILKESKPAVKGAGFKLKTRCQYCRRRLWASDGYIYCRTEHPGVEARKSP